MSLKEIIASTGGILFILMTLVQISPIKIDPWSWIGRLIGKVINGEVLKQMEAMRAELNDVRVDVKTVKNEAAEQRAKDARTRILRFGDEVRRGLAHSKDYYEQTIRDIKMYDDYCYENPEFENHVTEITSELIEESYREHMKKNDFL